LKPYQKVEEGEGIEGMQEEGLVAGGGRRGGKERFVLSGGRSEATRGADFRIKYVPRKQKPEKARHEVKDVEFSGMREGT